MRILTVVLLLTIIAQPCYAQHVRITGSVSDTAENHPLQNSVVMVLQQKDSFLISFVRADSKGGFSFTNLPSGKLILKVSYPRYADFITAFDLKDSTEEDLHTIPLILKSKLLQEVVVHGNMAAIRMKGDTMEFKADSFRVHQGASVEELLKKLPGIQVDGAGKITAQGQTVKKVLVDGEEFFGDDPTLVTQNLKADMVDKVQVYDKKSDQASFTGIDDGKKDKTINLQLKDNRKQGYFGKLEAGAGTNGFTNNQAMFNLFKNKMKFAAYGIWSNTGKTGLNWEETDKFGGGNQLGYDESGGYYFSTANNDDLVGWNGQYSNQGLPSVKTGGIHFNNKWDADKQSINLNYKLLDLDITGNSNTRQQTILPDTSFYSNSTEAFHNHITRNKADGAYEFAVDSSSSIKINVSAGSDHKTMQSAFVSDYLAKDSSLVNENHRTLSSEGEDRNVNSNLLYKKKFAKKGRTLSFNFRENLDDKQSTGFLRSGTEFFKKDSVSNIDNYKTYNSRELSLTSQLTYTEPLSKKSTIAINYGLNGENNRAKNNSFNADGAGKYDQLDSIYSSNYRFTQLSHRTGLLYNFGGSDLKFNIGNNWGFTRFRQTNVDSNTFLNRNFVNWYPQAMINYTVHQTGHLMLNYSGSTMQPTIAQLQPLANNKDPLNIYIGNPGLRPAFQNTINLSYFNFKLLHEQNISIGIYGTKTSNAISNASFVDSLGRQVNRAINVDGNYNLSSYIFFSQKIKIGKFDFRAFGNSDLNFNRYLNFVNGFSNRTDANSYQLRLGVDKGVEKKYNVELSGSAAYTTSTSTIAGAINTHYWTYSARPELTIYFPAKFQFYSDADMQFRQKTSAFDTRVNTIFWNAWFGKKFFKTESLLVKVSANDILNQNIGFNRNVNSNFISQNTYTTIQRYFMLSVIWNFTKTIGAPKP